MLILTSLLPAPFDAHQSISNLLNHEWQIGLGPVIQARTIFSESSGLGRTFLLEYWSPGPIFN